MGGTGGAAPAGGIDIAYGPSGEKKNDSRCNDLANDSGQALKGWHESRTSWAWRASLALVVFYMGTLNQYTRRMLDEELIIF